MYVIPNSDHKKKRELHAKTRIFFKSEMRRLPGITHMLGKGRERVTAMASIREDLIRVSQKIFFKQENNYLYSMLLVLIRVDSQIWDADLRQKAHLTQREKFIFMRVESALVKHFFRRSYRHRQRDSYRLPLQGY